jgi:hypothetical protein
VNVQKLFERYNRRFFGGKLCGWTVDEVHLHDSLNGFHGEYGDCCVERREIFIQMGLAPTEKRKTLLHEMCHAATPDDSLHGASWQREMFRIAELGARGIGSEARSYAAKSQAMLLK